MKKFMIALILLLSAVATAEPPCWQEQDKLLASDGAAGDQFGYSFSLSGGYAVVGAFGDDDNGSWSGSVNIFTPKDITSNNWDQVAKLTASDGTAGDYFGFSVSISGDYIIVGAFRDNDNGIQSGSAYIFTPNDVDPNNWDQMAKLTASDGAAGDYFGYSVALSGDYAIVGAFSDDNANGSDSGSAYVFTPNDVDPNNWDQVAKLTASDGAAWDVFGSSVSISGDTAIVGAFRNDDNGSESGSAYVFTPNNVDPSNWDQVAKLTASDAAAEDWFGHSVALSGDYAIVGALSDYNPNGSDSGSAYIFKRDGTNWVQQQKLLAADTGAGDYFGEAVAITGNTAMVGARFSDGNVTNSGSTYIFENICEPPIVALIDIDPDTLNKKSHGRWVTVYITLPDGFDVGAIDTSSIAITSLVGESCVPEYSQGADLGFVPQVGDRDEDGIADLTVKFDRQVLLPNLCLDDVAVTIEGELTTGEHFSGSDTIRIIDRGK